MKTPSANKPPNFNKPKEPAGSTSGPKRNRHSNSSGESLHKPPSKFQRFLIDQPEDLLTTAGKPQNTKPANQPQQPPVSTPRQNRTKVSSMNPSTSGNPGGRNNGNRNSPDSNNTDDFQVVEQNSQKVNIEDIATKPDVNRALLQLSSQEGLKTVTAFISAGKRFSEAIVKSRGAGRKFMRVMGLIVNIQTDPDQITSSDLTKQRMMALCHRLLYLSGLCETFSSPLVGRINFDETNPLTKIRPLIGAGFQFLGPVVALAFGPEGKKYGVLLFHAGCMALDYIRKTSPAYDSETGLTDGPLIDPSAVDFLSYSVMDVAGEGEVFVAGCRNIDQSTLSVLGAGSKAFYELISRIKIGRYGGSVGDRVAKNFSSIAKEMRGVVDRMGAQDF